MAEIRLLLKFLDTDLLFRLILALLIYSLVPVAEIFLFVFLGDLIGNWLTIALAAVAGVGGALVVFSQARSVVGRLRKRIRERRYPGREFADLTALLSAAILLVTPGFITDILGYLLLVPYVRDALRGFMARKLQKSFRDIYEHLRLSAL